jgi:hypothetical protein
MILSLSDVTINGHRYVKSDGSKLEPIFIRIGGTIPAESCNKAASKCIGSID